MADELKPVYLLTGTDQPKIERAVARLRGRYGEDAVERLSAASVTGADAVASCNAMGLFAGDGRLVLVSEVERWKAADASAVVDYLKSPTPDTVLALVGDAVKRDSPLAKACAKLGQVLAFDVQKRELPRWAAEQFALLRAEVDPAACRALVELVGDDLAALSSEIGKLAVWAAGERIEESHVEQLVAARADVPPFALTDAWGRRDVAAVLAACESILERSGSRTRELPALVGRLAAHVRRVRTCQRLDAEGVRPRDAAAQLKLHPFATEKAFAQSRNFSAEDLDRALTGLADLDLALKGGSRLPGELELQRALVAITRADDRAGAAAAA